MCLEVEASSHCVQINVDSFFIFSMCRVNNKKCEKNYILKKESLDYFQGIKSSVIGEMFFFSNDKLSFGQISDKGRTPKPRVHTRVRRLPEIIPNTSHS